MRLPVKKRIEYIDAMRGFTMILVVFSHVELFGFKLPPAESPLNTLFITFRMPLFFFISGYIAYKAGKIWTLKVWGDNMRKKILIQIVPTFVIGLVYTIITQNSLHEFLFSCEKLGYWFTLSLLSMFALYYTINLLFQRYGEKVLTKTLIGTAVSLYVLSIALPQIHIPFVRIISDVFILPKTFHYFQFFILGAVCAQHKTHFFERLDSKFTIAISLILYILLFWLIANILCTNGLFYSFSDLLNDLAYFFLVPAASYCGIIIIFQFFRKYHQSVSSSTRIGNSLQYIGRRTLDIYLLHYFFLPSMPILGTFFSITNNPLLELCCGVLISLLVVSICLVVSNILRTSDFLAQHLFGAKILPKSGDEQPE